MTNIVQAQPDPALAPIDPNRLVWMRSDIERRFGFPGSRYTRVGGLLPGFIATAITIFLYGVLFAIGSNPWVDMFTRRGWTPAVILFFALWAIMTLLLKRSKLEFQRRALKLSLMPQGAEFALSIHTVDQVLERLLQISDNPKCFVLLHRIDVGLSNVRNLGRVVDLGEVLRTQADHDESVMETSYNLIRGLIWAIPILGFIGTVSGLSTAIGGFGRVLSQTEDASLLIDALKGVTGGLATAFETTLLALIAALLVQMAMTFLKKREEEFLDECTQYCQREVLSRLRASEMKSQQQPESLAGAGSVSASSASGGNESAALAQPQRWATGQQQPAPDDAGPPCTKKKKKTVPNKTATPTKSSPSAKASPSVTPSVTTSVTTRPAQPAKPTPEPQPDPTIPVAIPAARRASDATRRASDAGGAASIPEAFSAEALEVEEIVEAEEVVDEDDDSAADVVIVE